MATEPHDIPAEQAILGAAMWAPAALNDARNTGITPASFYRPAHGEIWHTMLGLAATGHTPDLITLHDHLNTTGRLAACGGALYLHTLSEAGNAATAAQLPHYATIVIRHHHVREAVAAGQRIALVATQGDDGIFNARLAAAEWLDNTVPTARPEHTAVEFDDLLAESEENHHDWVIPGVLERTDRLILTGPEGGGKSTFLRQLAVQAASGIHPFTFEVIKAARVLIVDVENSRDQTRNEMRPLRIKAGSLYQPGQLHLQFRPEGMDLTQSADVEWLNTVVAHIKPDLLITGPIYKLANGDPIEEKSAKPVAVALDRIRVQNQCGLILEAHSPKTMVGHKRAIEPYGWSGWLRWPESGRHLSGEGEITLWRRDRTPRQWPALFKRGGEWPWMPEHDKNEALWRSIKKVRKEADDAMSYRELAQTIGVPLASVQRVIGIHKTDWEEINNT